MKNSCAECKFWISRLEMAAYSSIEDAVSDGEESNAAIRMRDVGKCQRYPPGNLVAGDAELFRLMGALSDYFTQPYTESYDWCGEFQRSAIGATQPRSE